MIAADKDNKGLLALYNPGKFYDELIGRDDDHAQRTAALRERLNRFDLADLQRRAKDAERELFNLGITFLIMSEKQAVDRILPFDVIPRVITGDEWKRLNAGVIQRVQTLNLFLYDVYHKQKSLKNNIIPADLIFGNGNFVTSMVGMNVPFDTYVHVSGIDLVRDSDGIFRVLEDNCRVPSGVSYVVENRHLIQRAFPDLMGDVNVLSVDDYGTKLHEALCEIGPPMVNDPRAVLLSPGTYNSAYFEHVFLSREMGIPLVESRDLVVENDRVYMKTTTGLSRVDTIYRRISDAFLDPLVFRSDSTLGVPGLMSAYATGNVGLANAIGTGVADDKAVYAYLPRLIKYFLDEEAIIPNVETNICREKEGLSYTLDHLDELVVKPVGEAGGYGITIGPMATQEQLEICRANLLKDPANYISQPVVPLSVCPTLTKDGLQPRHVDFRPFAITGQDTWVLPGGLTRVALHKGALIVNSSQGGGSKDTWVLE